ncbi:hypothetical protein YPPY59_3260, partial [Yersinia pestis PY-59]
MRIHP